MEKYMTIKDFMFTVSAFFLFIMCGLSVKAEDLSSLTSRPYISIKRGIHRVRFQERYGEPVFNQSFHMTSFGAGMEISENVAVELWHGSSRALDRLKALAASQNLPGCGVCVAADEMCVVRSKIKHASTDLHFLYTTPEMWNTRLLLGAGMSRVKISAHHQLYADSLAGVPTPDIMEMSKRSYSAKGFVPRGTLGVEHFIKKNLSIKAEYDWKRTRHITTRSLERPSGNAKVALRNTSVVSFGIVYKF